MTIALPRDDEGTLGGEAQRSVLSEQKRWDVILVGPGLGRGDSAVTFVRSLARGADLPIVFDADALHAIATDSESVRSRSAPSILTPHPGEAAVLLGTSIEEINTRRLESVREIANRYNAIVLLKGPTSLVTAPEDPIWFNWSGGPELATAGTGDVLAGVVAGLLSQGVGGLTSAVLGAHIHGLSGDQLAEKVGPGGIRAGRVADLLPNVIGFLNHWKEGDVGKSRGVITFPES
jgi:NAD(P)H-hydrate epimerase